MALDIRPFLVGLNKENNALVNHTPRISVQSVADKRRWTPVYIKQFTAAEAKQLGIEGQGNCFVVLLDRIGNPTYGSLNLYIDHGWKDMRPDEKPQTKPLDKSFPEPTGNISLFGAAKYWIEIADITNVPSDRVLGITLANPDDSDPNAHHSTLVIWQLQEVGQVTQPGMVQVPVSLILDIRERHKQLGVLLDGLM